MSDPYYKYCPRCATPLVEKQIFDAERLTCPSCGFIHFLDPKVVAIVVVENGGKVLLGKRNINPGKGLWSFPGGYVNRGEKVEDAATREIKEETNLDVHLDKLVGVYSSTGTPHILVVFRATVTDKQVEAMARQPEEVSELAFFPLNDVPELAFEFESQILLDWRSQDAEEIRQG